MAIALIIEEERFRQSWASAFNDFTHDIDLRIWPDLGCVDDIELAVTWRPPVGVLNSLPNLKAIHSIGAGINYIIETEHVPNVPILRVVDDRLKQDMAQFVSHAVLDHYIKMPHYRQAQLEKKWKPSKPLDHSTTVGVLGIGEIGLLTASTLQQLNFNVIGYSRTAKKDLPFKTFCGDTGLNDFLSASNILVCLLPLTDATTGILNKENFAKLPQGAYLINVGRGGHLVEADLIPAIESGQLSGATLDVFVEEPLPSTHPFWTCSAITVTPHISSQTVPSRVVELIIDNYQRLRSGKPLLNQVDLQRGY